MNRLSVISDLKDRADYIDRLLAGMFVIQSSARSGHSRPKPAKYTIVDVNLEDSTDLSNLRLWLKLRPKSGRVVFAVAQGVRRQVVQAYALGATGVVERPIDRKTLLTALLGGNGSDATTSAIQDSDGVLAGTVALQSAFASMASGRPADLKLIHAAGDTIVSHIAGEGLVRWIDIVRQHHSLTYQHCLLVTGIAVAFGQGLGFSSADNRKLAFGGLLHDIGKAGVPVDLLEKASPLTGEEVAVMRQHPQLGFDALRDAPELDPDILDMVVHHHEYLDGSGYPHGLAADQLSDLVRMMTIADVFGALIERRAYKAPSSCEAAYQVLTNMGSKLDRDLVREFRPIARLQIG